MQTVAGCYFIIRRFTKCIYEYTVTVSFTRCIIIDRSTRISNPGAFLIPLMVRIDSDNGNRYTKFRFNLSSGNCHNIFFMRMIFHRHPALGLMRLLLKKFSRIAESCLTSDLISAHG